MGQDESRKRTNHRELHPVPATCISKSNPAFRHLTEHSPRPHLPTSKIHPIHDPWLVDDPHCSSAMQTRQGTADLVYQTNRNKKTPLPRTITPAKKIPRPPGLRPGASTPPRPPVPHRPTGQAHLKIDSRALPDPCRKEPSVRPSAGLSLSLNKRDPPMIGRPALPFVIGALSFRSAAS